MKATPEGRVKAVIKKRLGGMGAWYFMPVAGVFGRVGIPDFIGCINGQFFAIEAKAGKGKATRIQEAVMSGIRAAGGIALIVDESNMNSFLLEK